MNPLRTLLNYLSRPQIKTLYVDDKVYIYEAKDLITCQWNNPEVPQNDSYIIAKLSEYVGNNYPGAWVSDDLSKNSTTGMRAFSIIKRNGYSYYVKWGRT